jgi:hypothetical protein
VQFAPRLSPRLLDFIEVVSSLHVPIAEINRLVGTEAERLGVPIPSYQRVRVLVHEARDLHRNYVSAAEILIDIATRTRSPYAYTELVTRPPRTRLRDLHHGK